MTRWRKTFVAALEQGAWALLLLVWLVFSLQSEAFLSWSNLTNTCVQASSAVLVATGMTFVLLTAGVDLSVGACMFLVAAIAGKLAVAGTPFIACVAAMLGVGILFGLINATIITRLQIIPFVATLATLYIGRGLGLWITQTRAINLPDAFLQLGSVRLASLPLPIVIVMAVTTAGQLMLSRTTLGLQIMAIGHDRESAERAGIPTRRVLVVVYGLAGLLAALGALISLSQLGTVSPTFGENREFTAIAAAVIGGTSLFGGRGSVIPGAVLGALLIQSVENGLVIINADPYLYPIVVSGIIFVAIFLDGVRNRLVQKMQRRPIFEE